MKHIGNLFFIVIFVFVIVFGKVTLEASKDALTLWFEKLVPSMFVTLVLIRLFYHRQVLDHIHIPFLPRFFHMDDASFSLVLCCMFLGFPNGAQLIDEDFTKHRLSLRSAQRMLYTCSFPAPGFVILSCGTLLFHSTRIGVLLFLSQIVSGLILLWLTRAQTINRIPSQQTTYPSIMKSLSRAIWESGKGLYTIGGYLMLFMSVTTVLFQFLPDKIALPLRIVSEFSSGTMLVQQLPYTTPTLCLLTCMLLSFGGFCVHMQVCSMCEHLHISYVRYLSYRILQSILSVTVCILFLL